MSALQQAIERLLSACDGITKHNENGELFTAIQIVITAAETAQWIDPKERMPEKRIRVLVCDNIGSVDVAFYGCQSSIAGEGKECWREDHESRDSKPGCEKEYRWEVYRWMPLPDGLVKNPLPDILNFKKSPSPQPKENQL